jgi:DNA-binding PadR family transcriptional regulator
MDISEMTSPAGLKPVAFHILASLANGDKHGYAMMQAVRELSGGQIPLQTGSFYRHLGQLMAAGLIAEASGRPPRDDPRRGAYYRLTPRGRQTLAAEAQRLKDLLAAIGTLRPSRKEAH